jgi:hypothetical protein
VGRGNDLKLPTIERMGGIDYLEEGTAIIGAIRVVEGGNNSGYRSTRWITLICVNWYSDEYATGC